MPEPRTIPRLAVSVAIVLLFVSLGMVVYFADHLVHSIQIDAINRRVERNTRRVIAQEDTATVEEAAPQIPEWAVPLRGRRSGYIQTVYPLLLLPLVSDADVTICLRKRVGEHVVGGTVIGWVWAPSPEDPRPMPSPLKRRSTPTSGLASSAPSNKTSRSASGSRSTSAARPCLRRSTIPTPRCRQSTTSPSSVATSRSGRSAPRSSRPGRPGPASSSRKTTSLITSSFIGDVLGRYGATDVTVMLALTRLLRSCAEVLPAGSPRLTTLDRAAAAVLADAERAMRRPSDVERVRAAVTSLRHTITTRRAQDDGHT